MTTDEAIAIAQARRVLRFTPALARDLRRQAGLTLCEVGDALGVTHAAVSRWESGRRIPRGTMARRYLDFLRRAAGTGVTQ